jgi:hypothetical protein
MTPAQIAEAQRLAREWDGIRPHGDLRRNASSIGGCIIADHQAADAGRV